MAETREEIFNMHTWLTCLSIEKNTNKERKNYDIKINILVIF